MNAKTLILTLLIHSSVLAQNSSDRIIEYKSYDDSLYSLLIFDFKSNYSFFIDYSSPNIKQSEGSFDLSTYDSIQMYSDTIFLYQSPIDGTAWPVIQQFHSMKMGIWKYYYSNGKLHYYGNYNQNLKEGEWKYLSDNGELQIIRIYSKGKIESEKIVAKGSYLHPEK